MLGGHGETLIVELEGISFFGVNALHILAQKMLFIAIESFHFTIFSVLP